VNHLVRWGRAAAFTLAFGITALCATRATAAPIKVACVGEHTTHSDEYTEMNRETVPAGKQEYPVFLQTLLGSSYDVRNFGDCCSTVVENYSGGPVHPFVNGAPAGKGPGYKESLAFLPDIVIIGSWGKHDWGQGKENQVPTFNLATFQADYDDLVQRYMKLSSHPKVFVSLPIPIPNGNGTARENGVTTESVLPAIRAVAAKYSLPIVDLYNTFLNHKELFAPGDGEHLTQAEGFPKLAATVHAAMMASASSGAGTGPDAGGTATGGGANGGSANGGVTDGGVSGGGGSAGVTDGGGGSSGATDGGGVGAAGGTLGTGASGTTTSAGGAGGSARKTGDSSSSGCSFAPGDQRRLGGGLVLLSLMLARARRRRR
jgi:hypothetical protein